MTDTDDGPHNVSRETRNAAARPRVEPSRLKSFDKRHTRFHYESHRLNFDYKDVLMARAVGIDLGTTNSVVSILEGGEPTVIANAQGSRTTPSVVAFAKNGEVLVGEVAKRQAVTNVDRTIRSVKREMGTNWSVEIDGKKSNPQQISAFVLQKLKQDAEAYLGARRSLDCWLCITVRLRVAYFDDASARQGRDARLEPAGTIEQALNLCWRAHSRDAR
ncbi:hypothetical protein GCM10018952_46740 [Streptosporangium vulgare]